MEDIPTTIKRRDLVIVDINENIFIKYNHNTHRYYRYLDLYYVLHNKNTHSYSI